MCEFRFTFDWDKKDFDKKCILCSNYSSCHKCFKLDDPLLKAPCADFLQADKPTSFMASVCYGCIFRCTYNDGQCFMEGCDFDLSNVDSYLRFHPLKNISSSDIKICPEYEAVYNLNCPHFFPKRFFSDVKRKVRNGEIKYEKC